MNGPATLQQRGNSWIVGLLLAATLASVGCREKAADPAAPAPDGSTPAAAGAPAAGQPQAPLTPPPAEIWKEFSGDRAFAEVRRQVEIGPRPSGSAEIEKARAHLMEFLQRVGWEVERQDFTDSTPRGPMKFANLIARFPATAGRPASRTTQRAVVCSHYDTKRFSTIQFAGANDGASSTGALLELARVLAMDPALATQIELVFFDGEEAVQQFTESDGLYGSRYYAKLQRDSGRARQFKFGILWDMIGDKDLTITLPPDSPKELTNQILAAAEKLGVRKHFRFHSQNIYDDHFPLNMAGIPTIDIIDFDYPAWHTADDTLAQISPESLRTIGSVTLLQLRTALQP